MVHSSGVGRAVSTGKAVIYHSVPDVIDTRTEVGGRRLRGQGVIASGPQYGGSWGRCWQCVLAECSSVDV